MNISKLFILLITILSVTACAKANTSILNPAIRETATLRPAEILPEPTIQYVTPVPCLSASQGLPVDSAILNSHILLQGYDPEGKGDRIWAYSIKDGSRKLVSEEGTYIGIAFLKDGYHFVFLSKEDNKVWTGTIEGSPLIKVDVDETLLRNFVSYSPIWDLLKNQASSYDYMVGRYHSPDGQRVAVWKEGDPTLVFEDKVEGKQTEIMKVKPGMGNFIAGNWSPDSSRYAFAYNEDDVSNQTWGSRVYLVNADGSGLIPLTDRFTEVNIYQVTWSPDGRKLALYLRHGFSNPWPHESIGIYSLETARLNIFSSGIPTSSSIMRQNDFVWSPDSQWIAFFGSWGQIDIRALDTNTGKSYCITQDPIAEKIMDWR